MMNGRDIIRVIRARKLIYVRGLAIDGSFRCPVDVASYKSRRQTRRTVKLGYTAQCSFLFKLLREAVSRRNPQKQLQTSSIRSLRPLEVGHRFRLGSVLNVTSYRVAVPGIELMSLRPYAMHIGKKAQHCR